MLGDAHTFDVNQSSNYVVVHDIDLLLKREKDSYLESEFYKLPFNYVNHDDSSEHDSCFSLSTNGVNSQSSVKCLNVVPNLELKNDNCKWNMKITSPIPFQMMMNRGEKTHTKSCKVLKRLEKEQKETEEKKNFRARPAPMHTFIPLYAKMKENEKQHVQERKEKVRERTLALQKPFDFYFREEVKKRFRAKSAPNLHHEQIHDFKAQVVPRNVFFSMQDIAATSTPTKKYCNFNHRFKGNEFINYVSAKNLNSLFRNMEDENRFKKLPQRNQRQKTSGKHLKSTIASKENQNCDNTLVLKKTCACCKDNPASRIFFVPPKLNWTTRLRFNHCRKEEHPESEVQKRQDWKIKIRRRLRNKISADLEAEFSERLWKKKEETKIRSLEYKNELKLMQKRLEDRPLLMEFQSENKFIIHLNGAGQNNGK